MRVQKIQELFKQRGELKLWDETVKQLLHGEYLGQILSHDGRSIREAQARKAKAERKRAQRHWRNVDMEAPCSTE
eukprot:COSAG02_NODE_1571_length_11882_cov_101.560299_5_plen_75_part_00